MTPNRVQVALEKYAKRIPADSVSSLKKHLTDADDDCMDEFMFLQTKNPVTALLLSIFLGGFGVDRFYLGDKGLGVAKLLLPIGASLLSVIPIIGWIIGGLASLAIGIWKFVDIFLVFRDAKRYNYHTLSGYLASHQKTKRTPNYSYDKANETKRTNDDYSPLASDYEPINADNSQNISEAAAQEVGSDNDMGSSDIVTPISIKNTEIDVIFTCPVCSQKMRITTVASKYCCPKCSTIFPYKNVVKNN